MHRFLGTALFFAVGCTGTKDTGELEPIEIEYEVIASGSAPWDPMQVRVKHSQDGRSFAAPLVDGEELDEPLSDHQGSYAWRSSTPLEVGEHTIAAPDGSAEQSHTVLPYGQEESFDPKLVVGQLYKLSSDTAWYGRAEGLLGLAEGQLSGVWLRAAAADGDTASVELYVAVEESSMCRALSVDATLTATGELAWSQATMDLEAKQGTIPMQDLSLRGGWLGDGSELGGVEASVTLHTALLSQEVLVIDGEPAGPEEMCSQLSSFGLECFDCAGDGDYCVELHMHGAVMVPDDIEDLDALPSCGTNLNKSGDLELSCEFPDFSCAAATFGVFGLAGLVRRRRPSEEALLVGSGPELFEDDARGGQRATGHKDA